MPIPDMAVAAQAQARVDEEIAKQRRLLCDLQTQRNSFSLIFRLPTETLAAIFICSARDYHSTHNGYPTGTAPSWVNVSYVCRHWRNVALNCATLWSYLFITSPRWTEELLARSKQASLKLHAKVPVDTPRGGLCFVGQVMNHRERIQEFHLGLPYANIKIPSFSSVGFPTLFNGDIRALRTLKLSCCPVPWYSFKLNNLTTLDLRLVPPQFQQNMVECLATLSSMQNLTHLYLHHAVASAAGFLSSAEFHTFQKINLPHLSRLFIGAPLSTVTAFLACVNIPMQTEVRLDCCFENGVALHDYATLFSVVARRLSTSTPQALSGPTFRSLIIDLTSYRPVLTFSPLERDCESFDLVLQQEWGCNTPLKISVCLFVSDTRSDLDCILDNISSFVPLMDVLSLRVINPPVSPAIWRSALGHLQDLRYLMLNSGNLPDLAPVLSLTNSTTSEGAEGQGERTNQSPDRMLVPVLEELELHGISFQKRSKKDMDKHPVDVQALCDALATCKGSSGRLTVTRCIERIRRGRSVQEKRFNMVGRWKNGRFRVVKKHNVT